MVFLRWFFDFFDLIFSKMVKNILRNVDFIIKKILHIFKKLIARIAVCFLKKVEKKSAYFFSKYTLF
jgi:hypothetical protein